MNFPRLPAPAMGHLYLLEVLVTDDILPFMGVLQFVGLDILPQCLNDHRAGLGVYPQETGQAGVQLELWRLRQKHDRDEKMRAVPWL